jgi:hypothetical protein
MNKNALQSIASDVATAYFEHGADLTEKIASVADEKGLTGEQAERVAHYANRKVNAELMKESAYTEFDTAEPEKIADLRAPKEASRGFAPEESAPQEKTASNGPAEEEIDVPVPGMFAKIASVYDTSYVPSKTASRDAKNLLEAADKIATAALSQLEGRAIKLARSKKELYEEAKQTLYEGASPQELVDSLKEEDVSDEAIEYILNRLEADNMVPKSTYSDDGPYSLEREYLKQGEIAEDSPLREAAREAQKIADNASLDAAAAKIAMKVARRAEELSGADFSERPGLREKQAGVFSTIGNKTLDFMKGVGNAGKKTVETAEGFGEGLGSWVAEKPMIRSLELGLGGYAAGNAYGDQKNDMEEPKRQFA